MTKFVNGEADVLLSTTIIESGLDIPNANTIIIDRADRFGLSDLYQLRGRVGRYKHQAYAYLLLPRHGGPAHRRAQAPQRDQAILHAGQRLQNRHARPGNPRRGQPARRGAKRPHHRRRLRALLPTAQAKRRGAEGREGQAAGRGAGAAGLPGAQPGRRESKVHSPKSKVTGGGERRSLGQSQRDHATSRTTRSPTSPSATSPTPGSASRSTASWRRRRIKPGCGA